MSQMKIKITPHQRALDQSGRRRSGVCLVSKQMNPKGGDEKTIKGHACHELITTALAVAPQTINPSSI